MSDSTSLFDQLSTSQSGKEVRINQLLDSVSQSALGGRRESTTTGFTWGYYGAKSLVNGAATAVANSTVTLTASSVNFVGQTQAGAVANTLTTANPLHAPLYSVTTSSGGVTGYTDQRTWEAFTRMSYGKASQAVTTANVTLTQAQALCDMLEITGALTAQRDVIVPLLRRAWNVFHNGTAFPVRFIGASGTGVIVDIGQRAAIECDGTNVYFPVGTIVTTAKVATTSGTSVNFTSIPAGVKRITVNLVGVSTNGTGAVSLQIGDSGGLETTGYTGAVGTISSAAVAGFPAAITTAFSLDGALAADARNGSVVLTLQDAATWTWCIQGVVYCGGTIAFVAGSKALSATLDRLSLITADTFDAGSVNILYE